jgi:N-acylneuraminate cytidylyltransferase
VRAHRFVWRERNGEAQSVNYDYRVRPRRQEMPPEFVENGSIYVFKPWVLRTFNNRLGGKITFYVMGYWSAIDIDSQDDLALCEWVLSHQGKGL